MTPHFQLGFMYDYKLRSIFMTLIGLLVLSYVGLPAMFSTTIDP